MRDPVQYEAILADSAGFGMASDRTTGQWLRAMAASKKGARLLELGTGTGLSACWILDGMDEGSSLLTVDNNAEYTAVARNHLGHDPRIDFIVDDGADVLRRLAQSGEGFDFIFADTWPGKFYELDLALSLLNVHGVYLIDDLLPQGNWPADHAPKVADLIDYLYSQETLSCVLLEAEPGLMMCTRLPVELAT